MTADTLRRAASLMRERAQASAPFAQSEGWWVPDGIRDVMWGFDDSIQGVAEDAEHIAAMSPAVALAVADWLEAQAKDVESFVDGERGWVTDEWRAANDAALAVARAYLGEDA